MVKSLCGPCLALQVRRGTGFWLAPCTSPKRWRAQATARFYRLPPVKSNWACPRVACKPPDLRPQIGGKLHHTISEAPPTAAQPHIVRRSPAIPFQRNAGPTWLRTCRPHELPLSLVGGMRRQWKQAWTPSPHCSRPDRCYSSIASPRTTICS